MRGQFECKDNMTYRMPVHFSQRSYNADNRVVYQQVMNFSVEQKTDMEALAKIVPSVFEITAPRLLWGYANCRDVDFMAHGEYRIFQVAVPVQYERDGQTLSGVYPLVILENDAVPILGGREEDGMPKLFCDIAGERHYENHWFASASMYCDTLLHMDFFEAGPMKAEALKHAQDHPVTNNFGYRYIPLVSSAGSATMGPILYPQESHPEFGWTGEMSVEIHPPKHWYENFTMAPILMTLASLPNYGFENATRTLGGIRLCVADSKAL